MLFLNMLWSWIRPHLNKFPFHLVNISWHYQENEIEPLHLLHAYSYECGVVIGQLECHKAKTNEISVSKELVDMLKLKDTVITADAMLMSERELLQK